MSPYLLVLLLAAQQPVVIDYEDKKTCLKAVAAIETRADTERIEITAVCVPQQEEYEDDQ